MLLWVRLEPTPGKLTPLVAEEMEGDAVAVPRLWEAAGTSGLRTFSAVSSSTAAIAAACSASCRSSTRGIHVVDGTVDMH